MLTKKKLCVLITMLVYQNISHLFLSPYLSHDKEYSLQPYSHSAIHPRCNGKIYPHLEAPTDTLKYSAVSLMVKYLDMTLLKPIFV